MYSENWGAIIKHTFQIYFLNLIILHIDLLKVIYNKCIYK